MSDRAVTLVLTILVALGAALRLYQLDSGLWYDEIATLINSVRPDLLQIVTQYPGNNDHTLYSVLAHSSLVVFGEHAWSIRLPAVVFGIASIPMLYLLGTAVTSRLESLLAATILTVSYHHVWFSQNARGYTALLFWVLLATFLLIQWLSHKKNNLMIAYAVVAALGSYTHLTMVFVVICHALICAWLLFVQKSSSDDLPDWRYGAAGFVAGGIITILLYAPMLQDMQEFFTDIPEMKKVETPFWALWETLRGLRVGFGPSSVVAVAAVVFGAGLLSYFKQQRAVFYLFVLPVPVTVLLAVAMGRPIFPRFVFFSVGFGLLIAVRGAAVIGAWLAQRVGGTISPQRVGMAMALLLTIGAIGFSARSLPYGYRYPKQDFGQAVEFVRQNRMQGDQVAVVGTTAAIPFIDYLGQPWQRVDRAEQLSGLRSGGREVLLIYTFPAYIQVRTPELWKMIQSDCKRLKSFHGTIAGGDIHVLRCSP